MQREKHLFRVSGWRLVTRKLHGTSMRDGNTAVQIRVVILWDRTNVPFVYLPGHFPTLQLPSLVKPPAWASLGQHLKLLASHSASVPHLLPCDEALMGLNGCLLEWALSMARFLLMRWPNSSTRETGSEAERAMLFQLGTEEYIICSFWLNQCFSNHFLVYLQNMLSRGVEAV